MFGVSMLEDMASSMVGESFFNIKKQVEKQQKKMGLTPEQVKAGYPMTYKSTIPKTIKFPNIEALRYWWITSGQYKKSFEEKGGSYYTAWQRLKKGYNITGKMRFLNRMIFMIASKIYMDKIAQAQANKKQHGIPFKTTGFVRKSKIRIPISKAVETGKQRRSLVDNRVINKYANYMDILARTRPNPIDRSDGTKRKFYRMRDTLYPKSKRSIDLTRINRKRKRNT